MQTYRNEQQGFEITIAEDWSFHSSPNGYSLIFKCSPNEAFNIQIRALKPEPTLDETEKELERYAQEKG